MDNLYLFKAPIPQNSFQQFAISLAKEDIPKGKLKLLKKVKIREEEPVITYYLDKNNDLWYRFGNFYYQPLFGIKEWLEKGYSPLEIKCAMIVDAINYTNNYVTQFFEDIVLEGIVLYKENLRNKEK